MVKEATPEKPKKVVHFKRVLLVAAAFMVVAVAAFSAGATLTPNSYSDGIIGFYKSFFKIDVADEETTASVVENDLASDMILESLNTRPIPQALLSEEYEKSINQVIQEDDKSIVYFDITNVKDGTSGKIIITQYKSAEHSMLNGVGYVSDTHREFKQLSIDGKEIIVFGMGNEMYINYSYGATNYEIALNCDFETMVSIAETISIKG